MRDLFTKDVGWKLFSLFLAAAIWLTVNRILHETNVPAPDTSVLTVTYDNQPVMVVSALADVRAFHIAPATVKVTVTGPASVMNKLQADEVHAHVNLTGASLTHGQLLPVEISGPPKVAVASIEPDRVLVIPPTIPDKKP